MNEQLPGRYDYHCPYCGIERATEWDHILPKNRFPEFAFLPQNLILVCGSCNKIKGEKYSKGKQRLFLNPYLDEFMKVKFLHYKYNFDVTRVDPLEAEMVISLPKKLLTQEKYTVKHHINLLNIISKSEKKYNKIIANRYRLMKKRFKRGDQLKHVIEDLQDEADTLCKDFGVNHPKALLFRGLVEHKIPEEVYNSKIWI